MSHDETIIKDYKEDMDTLLVFVSTGSIFASAQLSNSYIDKYLRLVYSLRSLPHSS